MTVAATVREPESTHPTPGSTTHGNHGNHREDEGAVDYPQIDRFMETNPDNPEEQFTFSTDDEFLPLAKFLLMYVSVYNRFD